MLVIPKNTHVGIEINTAYIPTWYICRTDLDANVSVFYP